MRPGGAVMTRHLALLLLRRAVLALPLVLAVITLTFFLVHLAPGDPAYILAGDAALPKLLAWIRAECKRPVSPALFHPLPMPTLWSVRSA
jgi:ABC-type dipeptide/oligopeptide/nickel transport system permease component